MDASTAPPWVEKLPIKRWLDNVDPARALLVQVGAHDHAEHSYHNPEPGPDCVRRGWRAILIEPMREPFARLHAQYGSLSAVTSGRVRLVNAAVCSSCSQPSAPMWTVSLSNTSDMGVQCLRALNDSYSWVPEISSLNKMHVLKHSFIFNWRPRECETCAARLGLPAGSLRPNCMHQVLKHNLELRSVNCVCLDRLLAGEHSVDLLAVDAEGFDADVLTQYPFSRLRTARVVYEYIHLNASAKADIVSLLESHGFVPLEQDGYTRAWRHANASVDLRSQRRASLPARRRPRGSKRAGTMR
jgi:hypothetical protein